MTTYTEYYHLGLQLDTSDKYNHTVITDNTQIIDSILHTLDTCKQDSLSAAQMNAVNSGITANILQELQNYVPVISSTTIDNTALASFFTGTICGLLDTAITGESTAIYGVVRAYTVDTDTAMQIAEDFNGGRHYRTYTSSTWSAWADSPNAITNAEIENAMGGE